MTADTATPPATVPAARPSTGRDWSDAVLNAYLAVFFAYLFLPLLLMVSHLLFLKVVVTIIIIIIIIEERRIIIPLF